MQTVCFPGDVFGANACSCGAQLKAALAAIELVQLQPAISSQMVDNLNASIHVRALLTDLFIIDEVLSPQTVAPSSIPQQG